MERTTNLPQENKKRAAFKRFSQIGTAGVAVISLSAFTNLSVNQLQAQVFNDTVKNQNSSTVNSKTEKLFDIENQKSNIFDLDTIPPATKLLQTDDLYDNNDDTLRYSDSRGLYLGYSKGIYFENYSNNYSNTCD